METPKTSFSSLAARSYTGHQPEEILGSASCWPDCCAATCHLGYGGGVRPSSEVARTMDTGPHILPFKQLQSRDILIILNKHYETPQLPSITPPAMENAPAGSSKKSTVYVGGFAEEVNEQQLLDTFVTFGMSQSAPDDKINTKDAHQVIYSRSICLRNPTNVSP
jgi:hypothetical protein